MITHARTNTILLVLIVVIGLATLATVARWAAAGPLDPPGAPAPTLPQVEPRSPIPPVGWDGTFPIVISQPGSYYLTRGLTGVASNAGISITTGHVTLDLNGFQLTGSYGNDAIQVSDGASSVTIRNGTITGWVKGISAGGSDESTASDLIITDGIGDAVDMGSGAFVHHVTASGNQNGVNIGDPHGKFFGGIVEDSVISRSAFRGLIVSANNVTIRRNAIESNPQAGMLVSGAFDVVIDNTVQGVIPGSCIGVTGTANTIARNVLGNCNSNWVTDLGTGNHIGAGTSDLTSTQPWSNVEY